MKQLHVVGGYPVGTHTFVLWQLRGALDRGHEVAVLAAHRGNQAGAEIAAELGLDPRIAIHADYRASPPWSLDPKRFSRAAADAANKARYGRMLAERRKSYFCDLVRRPEIRNVDLVQVHFVQWAVEIGIPLARLIERPCVVTAHAAVSETPIEFLHYVQERADAVIVVSDGERRTWIERTGSARKLHRVWNGLPLRPPGAREPATPARPLQLASIGRLSPEKRLADIINAVARLHRRGCRCRLSIFGEGPLRGQLQSRIGQLELGDDVRLEGACPHEQVMGCLAVSDILVHAADIEPFGLAMIEAMAAGLPVVAAGSNGAAEIVEHGTTGFLFPGGNVSCLEEHLIRLADDPELRRTMGQAGRQRVERAFSLDAHMHDMERIWRAAVKDIHPDPKAPDMVAINREGARE